jgi:HK97 family phage major capsid protein
MTTMTTADFPQRITYFKAEDVIPSALILQLATFTVPVEGDNVVVTVPHIAVDDDAGFVAEGADIDEADPDTGSIDIVTAKVAVLAKVAREAYVQDGMSGLLSASMRRGLIKKANTALLAQPAPVAPAITPPAGLLLQGVTDGGAIGASLDELIDAVATIEDAYGTPTAVVGSPLAYASLAKRKRGTGSNESLLSGTGDALPVPMLRTPAMPAGEFLVVDKAAVLGSWGQVSLAVSADAYFGSDSIGVRGTFRFGARIVDSERVVKLTIADE